LRYVWIAFAVAIGVGVVGYGALAVALADVCESNCGTAWPWVFIAFGAATIVAALVDAERTFRRNRRARSRRHRNPTTD
jgi:tellurite resistance protein TehA-like permease